jgi:hypothetical protein
MKEEATRKIQNKAKYPHFQSKIEGHMKNKPNSFSVSLCTRDLSRTRLPCHSFSEDRIRDGKKCKTKPIFLVFNTKTSNVQKQTQILLWHSRPRLWSFSSSRRDVRTFALFLLPFYFVSKQTHFLTLICVICVICGSPHTLDIRGLIQ